MSKIAWLDLETTGLDPERHGIIQAALIIEIDGKIEYENMFQMYPFGKEFSDEAMAIHGITPEEVEKYRFAVDVKKDIKEALSHFCDPYNKADKYFMGGYNVAFDFSFLCRLWEDTGDNYFSSFFWASKIDVLVLQGVMEELGYSEKPKNYRLSTLMDFYGIDNSHAHNAMVDISATEKIYKLMKQKLKQGVIHGV
jgi:DNA polymerase III subunit epsilon